MADHDERMRILEMLDEGRISSDEALRLLNDLPKEAASLRGADTESASTPIPDPIQKAPPDPQIEKWRQWWMIPLWIGVGAVVFSALLMYRAYQSSGIGFWFLCAWLPFLAGLGLMSLAWASRDSRWVHVRVHTGRKRRLRDVAISMPVPTRVAAWAVRSFGWRIPALQRTAIDDVLAAFDESLTPDAPIFIDVDNGESGERVQVFIG
ncbi:MAG: DUF2089 domain-containing protein [Chloroflexi bacterium]|nr:DUF2089 domain-containing protein [Chloroflexota bacterium]